MPKPFRTISEDDVALLMEQQVTGKELYSDFSLPLLTFSHDKLEQQCEQDEDYNFPPEQLKQTKEIKAAEEFTRQYVIKDMARQLESGLRTGDPEDAFAPETYFTLMFRADPPPDAEQLIQDLNANYTQKGASGEQERYRLIADFVENRMNQAVERFAEGGSDRHLSTLSHEQEAVGQTHQQGFIASLSANRKPSKDAMEEVLSGTLAQMPEWLQLLTHDTGFMAILTKPGKHVMGESFGDVSLGMPLIALDPAEVSPRKTEKPSERQERILMVREELLHAYHLASNKEAFISGKDINQRWTEAARKLVAKIYANPKHPALELIGKSEAGGGSLMQAHLQKDHSDELLIDIFDAEDYLRRKIRNQGGDLLYEKKTVEQELRKAFGDDVYDISREYIAAWVDKAAQVAEPVVGKKEAARLKQKWLDDPFNHDIIINKRPEFAISTGDSTPPLPK